MDKTKEFILQCEKAKEIQIPREAAYGDFFEYTHGVIAIGEYIYSPDFFNKNVDNAIWLPRQDQLQEMVNARDLGYNYNDIYSKIESLFGFMNQERKLLTPRGFIPQSVDYTSGFYYFRQRYPSMEQLWLAFVMKEKYNKRWDGKNWIEEER